MYAQGRDGKKRDSLAPIYHTLTYISGIFYYLSTTVNPLLYNIMSNKFREAFKVKKKILFFKYFISYARI